MKSTPAAASEKVQENIKNRTPIPWKDKTQWEQVLDSIKRVENRQTDFIGSIEELAVDICGRYEQLSEMIEKICAHTCPGCKDVCCVRATLWFDFKDLLYVYFAFGVFPETQISKSLNGGLKSCDHLTAKGCSLSRTRRPFVCTWYFCPAQKKYLSLQDHKVKNSIEEHLQEIKRLRGKLEDEFIRVASI